MGRTDRPAGTARPWSALVVVACAGLVGALLLRTSTEAGSGTPAVAPGGGDAPAARRGELRAPELALASRAADRVPGGVDLPAQPAGGADRAVEGAVAWLARLDRERFGGLTPEEAAALEELDLRGTEVADEDLRHLAELPALARLGLRGTAVGDAGLVHLQGLALETLELRGTQVTGDGLGLLPWTLQSLDLTGTQLESSDLYRLPGLPGLGKLDLNFIALDDTALEPLARLPALRHLECDQSRITADGLAMLLERNPLLSRVELRDTPVGGDEARALMSRYPGCELVVESSSHRYPPSRASR